MALPSAISEFTSSSSPSRTKERALDLLSVPGLPALVTPSICWLRSAAASDTLAQHPCSSTAVRASPLPAALPEPQSSQTLRAACAQPAAQSGRRVMAEHKAYVSSYGVSWASS